MTTRDEDALAAAAEPPTDGDVVDPSGADDGEDMDEAFIDPDAGDYEEVADLDEDDEAPMSSDDEDDEDMDAEADGPLEDRDAAEYDVKAPEKDDAEVIACAHSAPVYAVAWSSDATTATVASGGGDDRGFLRRGSDSMELRGHGESVASTAFSTDGGLLATGGLDGRVNVYDVSSGELRRTLEGPGGGIEWVAWHPRGRVCLAGSEDFTAWMWNADDGALMQVFSGHSESVSCGGFTPDGKQVVTGSFDGSLRVWQPRTGVCEHLFRGHPFHDGPLTCLGFHSSTPGLMITGSEDNTARLVSSATGKVLAPLVAHTETIEAVGFCDVMPLAATGSLDKNIVIWDTNSCQARGTLVHDGAVSQLRWVPNSMCLYSTSIDGAVRLWDARTSSCQRIARGHTKGILDFAMSPDFTRVITASDDCTARIFNFGTG